MKTTRDVMKGTRAEPGLAQQRGSGTLTMERELKIALEAVEARKWVTAYCAVDRAWEAVPLCGVRLESISDRLATIRPAILAAKREETRRSGSTEDARYCADCIRYALEECALEVER